MAQLHHYEVLLETETTRRKLRVEYSQPKLVNGSINPPPSRFYPGKRCHMVTVYINERAFHGFGPTVSIAKSAAAYEAYKTLFDVSKASAGIAQNRQQSPLELVKIPCVSATSCSQEMPILLQWSNLSQINEEDDSLQLYNLSTDAQSICGDLQCQPCSPSTAQKYCVPQTQQETIDQLIRNSVGPVCQRTTHSDKHCFGTFNVRSVTDKLLELAKRKRVKVQFETVHRGRFVTVKASTGLHSREATSKKQRVAKCLALQKLMKVIDDLSYNALAVTECGKENTQTSQYLLETSCNSKFPPDSTHTWLSSQPLSCAIGFPPCVKSLNPIGQLNEVMMEKGKDVQFSFCFHGKSFWCCAMAMNKSSLGFGSSKQLAKEMASLNMLSLLWYRGINIFPQRKSSAIEPSGNRNHGGLCAELLPYTHQKPPPHPLEQMLAAREKMRNSVRIPLDQYPFLLDAQLATDDGSSLSPPSLDTPRLEQQSSNLSSLMADLSLADHSVTTKEGFLNNSEVLCGTDVVWSSEGAVCLPSAGSVDLYKDIPLQL